MKNNEMLSLTKKLETDPFYLTKRLIEAGFYELYKFIIKVSKVIPGVTSEITIDKFDNYHRLFSKYVSNVLPLYDSSNTKLITDGGGIGVQATYPANEETNTVGFSILDKQLDDSYQVLFDTSASRGRSSTPTSWRRASTTPSSAR